MMMLERTSRILIALATLAVIGLAPAISAAQDLPELQLQRFRPGPGPTDFINVYGSKVAPHLDPDFSAWFDFANDPFVAPSASEEFTGIVDSQVHLSLTANIGLFDFMEVGLLVPVLLTQSTEDLEPILAPGADPATAELKSQAVNDIRISTKFQIMDILRNPLGLAFVLAGYIPTGVDDAFAGDESFAIEARGATDFFVGNGIRIGANLGYMYRHEAVQLRDAIIGDEIIWGVAAQWPLFIDTLDLITELDGAVGVASKPEGQGGVQEGEVPAELKAALRYRVHEDWALTGGFGFGMNSDAIGTPDFRLFVGFGGPWVSGGQWGYDYDGDGIYGVYDKCPQAAEDFDGFEDLDGCPDSDNDGDGIPDDQDKCDNTPEGVSIGPDGCPDNDLDGDGIPNDMDKCPEDPEDIDRFQDSDGCPDTDNDQDGIPDTSDNCPNDPETFNDFLDDDGCPDDPNDKVHISRDRIIITEQVYFNTGKTTIQKKSFEILDAVVEVMKANPQIEKIRVEGHTDSRGSDEFNLTLSQGRAESVQRYLTDKGIAEGRLEAVGYGETRPIRDNETAEGRSYNRRVEFTILEMRGY